MFGDGPAYPVHVRFLESVGTDLRKRNLPGDEHHRHAVHIGGGKPGNRIGGARTARHQTDAGLAGRTGIAVGHVSRTLFVTAEHELKLRFRTFIENIQNRSAGIAEKHFHSGLFQALHERLRACSLAFVFHQRIFYQICSIITERF